MAETVIVIPCYNESARFQAGAFERFAAATPGVRFIFVNDGSTDDTRTVLEQLARDRGEVFQLLELASNSGKAEAVRQGVLAALALDPRHVGYWDADLATPLDVIPSLISILDERAETELVMGSRVQLLGRDIDRRPWRHYMGRVFATAVSMLLALRVYDTQCGAKLFRASPRVREIFEQPFLSRWLLDVELLARLAITLDASGRSLSGAVYEYPLPRWHDVRGSRLRLRDFIAAPVALAGIFVHYRRVRRLNLAHAGTRIAARQRAS